MLGGVAHQCINAFDGAAKVFVVREHAAAIGLARGLAVMLVDVDQVDIAGDIELARAQLAHADDPELHVLPGRAFGRAMAGVQLGTHLGACTVQSQLSQLGDSAGHYRKRSTLFAVHGDDAVHHQLAQHAQPGS